MSDDLVRTNFTELLLTLIKLNIYSNYILRLGMFIFSKNIFYDLYKILNTFYMP